MSPKAAILAGAMIASLGAGSASAADCLSPSDGRDAVQRGDVIPLSHAARSLTDRHGGQIVRADLCRDGNRLIYRLTVLGRRGEVHTAFVDAGSGQIIGER